MPLVLLNPYKKRISTLLIDPQWDKVSLLMKMDGAQDSAVFTDVKGHAISVSGTTVDVSNAKYGQAAHFYGNTNSYLTTPNHADFDFGAGDFTIEFWIKLNSIPDIAVAVVGKWPTSWLVYMNPNGLIFYINNSTSVVSVNTPAWEMGRYYHIAITRQGTGWTIWIDGVAAATATNAATISSGSEALYIGKNGSNNRNFVDGFVDDLRITKGVARYIEPFTPPAEALPDRGAIPNLGGAWDSSIGFNSYSNADKTVQIGGNRYARSVNQFSAGKTFFEVTLDAWNTYGPIVGVFPHDSTASYGSTSSVCIWVHNGGQTQLVVEGNFINSYGTTWTGGDRLGVLTDLDTNTVSFYKNGNYIGVSHALAAGKTWRAFAGSPGGAYSPTVTSVF